MSKEGWTGEEQREAQLAQHTNAPYIHMIIPTADGRYLAEVLELPGCITDGRTPEEAYSNLEEAKAVYLESAQMRGELIPEPIGLKEFSGNIPLRISSELHRMAALRAKQEGVSLNQWVGKALTMQATAEAVGDKIAGIVASKMAAVHQLSVTREILTLQTTSNLVSAMDASEWVHSKAFERAGGAVTLTNLLAETQKTTQEKPTRLKKEVMRHA